MCQSFEVIKQNMQSFNIEDIKHGSTFIVGALRQTTELDKKFIKKKANEIISLLMQLFT